MPVVKIPGVPVVLAGETYVVPPLALGALAQLQQRIAKVDGNVFEGEQLQTILDAAHAALKRNYPDITIEQVGELVDVGNALDVFQAVMDVSGLRRKALEAPTAAEGAGPGES